MPIKVSTFDSRNRRTCEPAVKKIILVALHQLKAMCTLKLRSTLGSIVQTVQLLSGTHFIMAALWNRADRYIFALWFLSFFLSRWKCTTQKVAKKSPSGHHRTNFSGYIFATKAHIDNRKKTC